MSIVSKIYRLKDYIYNENMGEQSTLVPQSDVIYKKLGQLFGEPEHTLKAIITQSTLPQIHFPIVI